MGLCTHSRLVGSAVRAYHEQPLCTHVQEADSTLQHAVLSSPREDAGIKRLFTFIHLAVGFVRCFKQVKSRIERSTALLGVLLTPNCAGKRTNKARNYIVRVPAIVRVNSRVTYPHYISPPTVV